MATSSVTRVLVVGLGSIGRRHARLFAERQDVALSICDGVEAFRQETLATLQRPAQAFGELKAALERGQDLVVIATPNHTHVPIGLEALNAGADLLTEKPISDKLDQAKLLVDAAKQAGRFMEVGYQLRYDIGLQRIKQWIDAGDLGNLVSGRTMIGTYITLLNARSPDRASRPNSLIVDYTHEIDFLRWIFGPAQSVAAAGATIGNVELKPTPNVFQMILRTAGNALVQVHMDYLQYPQRRILEVHGDRGTVSYDFQSGEIRKFAHQREHQWTNHNVQPAADRWDDFFRIQHEAILNNRRAGRPPVVSGEDGLLALQVAEAAIEAAAKRCWVDLA